MYATNQAAIFKAATSCRATGKPVVVTGRLLKRADAVRAFAEWENLNGRAGVRMRLTNTANGEVAAEFTPDQTG